LISSEERWILTREAVGNGRLSVVIPLAEFDSDAAPKSNAVEEIFKRHSVPIEIITVDCGNRGRGAALLEGFERSTGEYILILDGSFERNPELTPAYFKQLVTSGADAVIGSKRHPESLVEYPWHRRLASVCYSLVLRLAFGVRVTDVQSGMKLFRRECLGYALTRMLCKDNAFDLELLAIIAQKGGVLAEAPVIAESARSFGPLQPSFVHHALHDTLAVFYRLRILDYYRKCLVPKRLDHDPLVSIVIACPKRSWMLDECLAAIEQQTYRKYEVLALDDERTGKIRPAEKRNIGIREAKGEIIAFIDDDAYPDPHWLEYAVKYFGDEDVGAVGGPGATPPGDRRLARIGGRVYDNWLVSGNYRYRYRAGGVRMDVEDYPSCNLFVRKSILEKIGGYRTDFWPGEDTLLCKDIIDNWKRIIYDPWVVVYHHRRPLFLPHLRQLGRYGFHRGYFCKRFPSNSLRLSYFIPTIFDVYLVLLFFLMMFRAAGIVYAALPLFIYFVFVLLTSFSFKPHHWILTAVGVVLSHIWYGVRFIQGLCAAKAPCEYIGKDHAMGEATK